MPVRLCARTRRVNVIDDGESVSCAFSTELAKVDMRKFDNARKGNRLSARMLRS